MPILLKRLLVLLLIPAGMVLLVTPLPTHRGAYVEQDFVFISAAPLSAGTKSDHEVLRITRDELRSYPRILRAVEERARDLATFRASIEETGDSPGLEELGQTLSDREGISPEAAERLRESFAKSEEIIRRAVESSRKVQGTILASRQESRQRAPSDVPVGEWQRMVRELLAPGERAALFLFDGYLYRGSVRHDSAFVDQPITGLDTGLKIAGGAFLLIGIWLITGLYREKTGIMIGKRGGIVLWDVICIFISGFFLYGAIDLFLVKVFGTPMATEEFLQLMGIFWLIFALPALSIFISATAAQSVEINGKGIRLNGLFSRRFLPWEDLRGIEVTELRSVKRADSFTAPKRLMKIMRLKGESTSITLMEPPLKSTKRRIIETLAAQAPEKWRETIAEEGKTWLAFF